MSDLDKIKAQLIHAATAYDRRRSTRKGYNIYALAQYFTRIDDCLEDMRNGASPRAAIGAGFNDQLRDALLKAIGEPALTVEETRRTRAAWFYIPASES